MNNFLSLDRSVRIPAERTGRRRCVELRTGIVVFAALLAFVVAPTNETLAEETDKQPLVPGFGVEFEDPLVPGFGSAGEYFAVVVTEKDLRTADERFRQYDLNRDGYLSRDELARNRWSDDPLVFDRNRDGRLSKGEMAFRYARRRVDELRKEADRLMKFYVDLDANKNRILEPAEYARNEARRTIEQRIREAGLDPSRPIPLNVFMSKRLGNAGVASEQTKKYVRTLGSPKIKMDASRQRAEADRLMKFYVGIDANKNGALEPAEYARNPARATIEQRIREVGMDPSRPVSLKSFMTKRLGKAGIASTHTSRVVKSLGSSPTRSFGPRRSASRGRLPAGIPDWFPERDINGDGQIQMAEYSSNWTDARLAEYRHFDLNGDGVITPKEFIASQAEETGE